jgi:hypothetical protein
VELYITFILLTEVLAQTASPRLNGVQWLVEALTKDEALTSIRVYCTPEEELGSQPIKLGTRGEGGGNPQKAEETKSHQDAVQKSVKSR